MSNANGPASTADRPRFHFTAGGWINDPHAITVHGGRYHVFFQYVPGSTRWDIGCHWGHAVGDDLLDLREGPVALRPDEGDDGVWSGSLISGHGAEPRILYTSVSRNAPALGRIRTATPVDDEWTAWEKGPVVVGVPSDPRLRSFRDPSVIHRDGRWHMVVGAEFSGGVAGALLYSSEDGTDWRDDGLLLSRATTERSPVWTGSMWECPQLVRVDGRDVLVVSVWEAQIIRHVAAAVGDFADGRFERAAWARLGYGAPYAATAFTDAEGLPGLLFWIRDVSGDGWAGAHSIPYRLRIEEGALALAPHPDLERYHAPPELGVAAGGAAALDLAWPAEGPPRVAVRDSAGRRVAVTREGGELVIETPAAVERVPWSGEVRVILDGPILEAVSAGGVVATPIEPLSADCEVDGDGVAVRALVRDRG